MARRSLKLAEALKDEISEVVGFELDDPRLERVTVTDVTVTEDLRDAKVFVLVHGDEHEVGEAMKALQNAMVFVRQQVAMNLSLRHVPHLHFARDTAEENAARVNQLLSGITIESEEIEKEENGDQTRK
ncbi:MAG: 30S ribosome-binding factor RbfA [Pyrinomonadaceae bacterium]